MRLVRVMACAATASAVAASVAWAEDTHYAGRWTIADQAQALSANGKPYKTVDVNLCGPDYCGVSVSDAGKCGTTLFHLSRDGINDQGASGVARYGRNRYQMTDSVTQATDSDDWHFEIYIGRGYDFSTRRASMPTFDAVYKRVGEPTCKGK